MQTTSISDRWWHRGLRLLLGCAGVCFALMAADLAMLEHELAGVPRPAEMISAGVVAGPIAGRVRGGTPPVSRTGSGISDPSPTSGELARGISRHRAELAAMVRGRRVEDVAYLEVGDLTRVLGGELEQAAPTAPATFLCPAGVVEIVPASTSARRNFEPVTLEEPPAVIEERLCVPIRELETLADVEVSWSEARRRFRLKSDDVDLEAVMLEDMFDLELDRSDRLMQIRYLGHLIATWSICVGAGGNTPIGTFHIQNKAEWAAWRAYWGEYIPGGSRRNPLGARWLGTTARGRETGRAIGIHGTNQPSSIGRRISGGCIRLTNAHAIELYNTIPVGTRVVIHE